MAMIVGTPPASRPFDKRFRFSQSVEGLRRFPQWERLREMKKIWVLVCRN